MDHAKLFVRHAALGAALIACTCAARADCQLDPSFSGDGRVTAERADQPAMRFAAGSVLRDDDGYYVVGPSTRGTPRAHDVAVARLRADGTLDASFGDGGIAGHGIAATGTVASRSAVGARYSDGRVLVVGAVRIDGRSRAVAIRFLPTGELDTTFADDGEKVFDFIPAPTGDSEVQAVALDAQGRAVITGFATQDAGPQAGVPIVRLLDTGEFDPTFDGDGRRIVPVANANSQTATGAGIALDAQSRIVVGGSVDNRMLAVRLLEGGGNDPAFGGGSPVVITFFQPGSPGVRADTYAAAIVVRASGAVALAGFQQIFDQRMAVAQLTDAGLPLPGFGDAGRVVLSAVGGQARAIAEDDAQRLVLAGNAARDVPPNIDFIVVRIDGAGEPDATFCGAGARHIPFDRVQRGSDFGEAMFIDGERIVIAGTALDSASSGTFLRGALAAARLDNGLVFADGFE